MPNVESVVPKTHSSGRGVIPTTTAPAARSRRTTSWSSGCGRRVGRRRAVAHRLAGDRHVVLDRDGHAGQRQVARGRAARRPRRPRAARRRRAPRGRRCMCGSAASMRSSAASTALRAVSAPGVHCGRDVGGGLGQGAHAARDASGPQVGRRCGSVVPWLRLVGLRRAPPGPRRRAPGHGRGRPAVEATLDAVAAHARLEARPARTSPGRAAPVLERLRADLGAAGCPAPVRRLHRERQRRPRRLLDAWVAAGRAAASRSCRGVGAEHRGVHRHAAAPEVPSAPMPRARWTSRPWSVGWPPIPPTSST